MVSVPSNPKIYHITHVNNLLNIVTSKGLVSDARRIASGLTCSLVGMSTIKQRRLTEIEVSCHQGTKVGEYVPFYFCPRSIMLYILHMGNHPDVSYRGGQQPMIHLEADFHKVVNWANSNKVPWAFSNGNAGAILTIFYNDPCKLTEIDWSAVASRDFRDAKVKEGKQAEFLMFDIFPWTLVEKIGTINSTTAKEAQKALVGAEHQPVIDVEPDWYFC
jgi:ssDNA thymidine ADP-ribosyltransferase, DarT